MKTSAELEQDILNITMDIDKKFPELSKYIKEMPITISENPTDVNDRNLEGYDNSLVEPLAEYAKTHVVTKKENAEKQGFPGYPLYPASEDIYKHEKKELELNPNDLSKKKTPN